MLNTREMAELLELGETTIKEWEKEFGLTVPRGARNRRAYHDEHLKLYEKIKVLRVGKGLETPEVLAELGEEIRLVNAKHAPLLTNQEVAEAPSYVMALLRQVEDLRKENQSLYSENADLYERMLNLTKTASMAETYQERCRGLEAQLALPPAPAPAPARQGLLSRLLKALAPTH